MTALRRGAARARGERRLHRRAGGVRDDGAIAWTARGRKGGTPCPPSSSPSICQIARCHRGFRPPRRKGTPWWNRALEDKVLVAAVQLRSPHRHRAATPRRQALAGGLLLARGEGSPVIRPRGPTTWGYYIYSVIRGSTICAFESSAWPIPRPRHRACRARIRVVRAPAQRGHSSLTGQGHRPARELLDYKWFQKKPGRRRSKRNFSRGFFPPAGSSTSWTPSRQGLPVISPRSTSCPKLKEKNWWTSRQSGSAGNGRELARRARSLTRARRDNAIVDQIQPERRCRPRDVLKR